MHRSSYAHFVFMSVRARLSGTQIWSARLPGTQLWAALLLGAFLAIAPGCSSTGETGRPAKTGRAQRVLYVRYAQQQKFELVNDSHTDRTAMYSTTKSVGQAYTKVASDEVLDEIVKQFKDGGFFERAAPGSAPTEGAPGLTQAIEVEDAGKIVYWAPRGAVSTADAELFSRCRTLLLTVYSETLQMQSVDKSPDWDRQNQDVLRNANKAGKKKP